METELLPGDIVKSRMGRDAGVEYVILSIDGDFAHCSNGQTRKVNDPKKKRLKHLQKVSARTNYMKEKLENGSKITNVELRRELSQDDG